VEAIAPTPSGHKSPRELVNNDDLTLLNNVVAIALIQDVRAKRLLHVVIQFDIGRVIEIAAVQQFLNFEDAFFRESNRAVLFVNGEIACRVGLPWLFPLDDFTAFEVRNDVVDAAV
jgi:hypothetical protein